MSQQATEQVYGHYVDGEWIEGSGGDSFESENPATGETLATFQRGTDDDVDAALEAAHEAFDEWRSLSYIDRAEYLWDIYHELRERHEELGEIVTKECGKEISEGKADVTEAWHMVEWAAGNARHPTATWFHRKSQRKTPTCAGNLEASSAVSRPGTPRRDPVLAHGDRTRRGERGGLETRRADAEVARSSPR